MTTKGTLKYPHSRSHHTGRNELHVTRERGCVTLAWRTPLFCLLVSCSPISCRMRVLGSRWCSEDHGSPCARWPCG